MPKVTSIQGGQNATETCNKIKCLTIQSSCSSVLCVYDDAARLQNEGPQTMSSPKSPATTRVVEETETRGTPDLK